MNVRVFLGRIELAIDKEFDFGRDPATAFYLLVAVELSLLDALFVPAPELEEADEKKILFVYPELRRGEVALFCADNDGGAVLPRLLVNNRHIDAETFELCGGRLNRLAINVEPKHEQRMDKIAASGELAITKLVELAVGKDNAVALFKRRDIDAQLSGNSESLVP